MKTRIKLSDDINLVSFLNLKGKILNVKDIKNVEMASGKLAFYIVEYGGYEYEINENYVTQISMGMEFKDHFGSRVFLLGFDDNPKNKPLICKNINTSKTCFYHLNQLSQ